MHAHNRTLCYASGRGTYNPAVWGLSSVSGLAQTFRTLSATPAGVPARALARQAVRFRYRSGVPTPADQRRDEYSQDFFRYTGRRAGSRTRTARRPVPLPCPPGTVLWGAAPIPLQISNDVTCRCMKPHTSTGVTARRFRMFIKMASRVDLLCDVLFKLVKNSKKSNFL